MIIALSVVAAVILAFLLADGTLMKSNYSEVWSDDYISGLETPVEKLTALGIRAQSSHNSQPWLIKATGENTFDLYADTEKALAVVDADNSQMAISQGTFIEALVSGAKSIGYEVDVTLYDADMETDRPKVASFVIKEHAGTTDAVSGSSILLKKTDAGDSLNERINSAFAKFDNLSYEVIDGGTELEELKEILLAGTVAESTDEAAMVELLEFFRWTERDLNKTRYGLSLNTMPAMMKPFIQPIMKMSSGNWESFGKSGITMFEDRIGQEQGYILICSEEPSAADYINAGRAYQSLVFGSNGLVLKPAMQVLEDFRAMEGPSDIFRRKFGENRNVIMIIGISGSAGAKTPNPRHLPEDIIIY